MKEKKEIIEAFRTHHRFVITSHRNIDGDGLGSMLATFFWLKDEGKEVFMVQDGTVPYFYQFLPGKEEVLTPQEFYSLSFSSNPEVVIVLDCSHPQRLGKLEELCNKASLLVNIDHHPDNACFGNINWVVPNSSSTALLVYELIKEAGIKINSSMAVNLLTGFVTDTGGFQFVDMDSHLLRVVEDLIVSGASLAQIMHYAFHFRRKEALKLLGRALDHLFYDENFRFSVIYLTRKDFADCGAQEEDSEGIVDYGLYIPGAELSLLFKEVEEGCFRVSLRSQGEKDVLPIAHYFGGGGHHKAAGFRIQGDLSQVKEEVLDVVRKSLSNSSSLIKEVEKDSARRDTECL
ncbi:MAG: DHH family phosphoesterase [Candidatus Atribacteria bacterium]|nr:DHH family phosphoesterase [Candidatus Atribacteria bacterium]